MFCTISISSSSFCSCFFLKNTKKNSERGLRAETKIALIGLFFFFTTFYTPWVKSCTLNHLYLFCSTRVHDVEKACASGMCHALCQMVRVSRMAAWWMMSYVEIRSPQWMETQTSSCRSPVLSPAQVGNFNSETGWIQICEAVFIKCV